MKAEKQADVWQEAENARLKKIEEDKEAEIQR